MLVVIQRSLEASVTINNSIYSQIKHGLVLLVCIEKGDTQSQVQAAAEKIIQLRCFPDPATQKMGATVVQHGGEILAVSQFTLSWDGKKGNRPSFDGSAPPDQAQMLFDQFVSLLRGHVPVSTGQFGAAMKVTLVNDGPVTFSLKF